MRSERLIEFCVYLDDRPGELAGVLEAINAAGVTIRSVNVHDDKGRGLVRLIGSPVEPLRGACERLAETGVGPVAEAEVVTVAFEGRPSAFRDVAARFADTRVNVRYAYLAPAVNGTPACCVFRVDDPDLAERAIASLH